MGVALSLLHVPKHCFDSNSPLHVVVVVRRGFVPPIEFLTFE